MDILPLGTIVQLKNGTQKIMITSRAPLYNQNGTVGYFDYAACLYPRGQVDQDAYFFNAEDIDQVFFEGYRDEQEEKFCQQYQEKIGQVSYPHLQTRP